MDANNHFPCSSVPFLACKVTFHHSDHLKACKIPAIPQPACEPQCLVLWKPKFLWPVIT